MKKPNASFILGWTVGIGLLSASILGFEIALTNVFGVLLQYHYVALIVSFAICGIGLGAYAARKGGRQTKSLLLRKAAWMSLGVGVYYAGISFGLASFPFVNQMLVYMAIAMIPFVVFGWGLGTAFIVAGESLGSLYAADLLGAGVGAIAVYGCLNLLGGLQTIYGLCLLPLLASLLLFAAARRGSLEEDNGTMPQRKLGSGLMVSIILLIVMPFGWFAADAAGAWNIDFTSMKGAPPDKTLVSTLKSDAKAHIVHSEWDAFARTDVVETEDPNRKILFVDGGAGSYMYKFDGSLKTVSNLASDIEFLPFVVGSSAKTAVIGAGGGRDILYSLLSGSKDVTSIEVSPGIVKSVRAFGDYNGGLLDRPDVHTVIGDGRNVMERSKDQYDLIVLDLVYSQVGGLRSQTMVENYVYTQEAFETYLKRLNPNGRIIIIAHQGIEGIRAFYTGFAALMNTTGAAPLEASGHTALLMGSGTSKAPNLTLAIIQNTPLADEQLKLLNLGSQSLKLTQLFLPKSHEQLLKPLLDDKMTFDKFIRDTNFNVYPTSDDRPFFFQIERLFPQSLWQWLIAIILITAAFAAYSWRFGSGLTTAAALLKEKSFVTSHDDSSSSRLIQPKWLAFFSLVGIGYMSLQLPLIQMAMLILGSPVVAASVIIVAMLLGASVGSFLVQRKRMRISAAVIGILFITTVFIIMRSAFGDQWMELTITWRVVTLGLIVFLLGICLGVPLPSGLMKEERRVPGSSPYWFAVNGIAGLWGSWIAMAVAMAFGFKYSLLLGAVCYIGVALLHKNKYDIGDKKYELKSLS
jgi:spermidine synthase